MSEVYPKRGEQKLKYYKDPECKTQINTIEFPEPVVRGEEKAELVVYARNETTGETLENLKFDPKDPDLKIEQSGDKCGPKEAIMLKLIFTPSENRDKRLNSEFTVSGRAIVRG